MSEINVNEIRQMKLLKLCFKKRAQSGCITANPPQYYYNVLDLGIHVPCNQVSPSLTISLGLCINGDCNEKEG